MKLRVLGISLVCSLGLIGFGGMTVQAKTVTYGSLTPAQRSQSYMRLLVARPDNRFAARKVMYPINVKLKNTTNHAYRYYFTQLYVDSEDLLKGGRYLYRVHGPHKHVIVKAHSTKTVKKAFYENDQFLLSWVAPGSGDHTYLKYGRSSQYYVEYFKNSRTEVDRLLGQHRKYICYEH